jgi:serine/threonine-protein kinase
VDAKAFGRYEVRQPIGDGAMGRVYRGFDPLVRRPVAIKTVKSEYLTKDTREEYLRRFRREAQAAGSLSHHNIVGIYDVGADYIVMEHVDGITLDGLLRQRTVLSLDEAMRLLVPLADALDYAHRAGVVHRDIKPGNIMVQPDGRPKLMDFGVARLEASAITTEGVFFGSPSYMAPEQILSHEVTARADIFSLGVVAYEMLTGTRPFRGDTITSIMYRVVNEPVPPPTSFNLALPERCDEVFRRALDKKPEERFASASAFVAALGGSEQALDPAAWPPLPVVEAELARSMAAVETQELGGAQSGSVVRRRRRRARLVAAAAVALLAAEVAWLQGTAPARSPAPPAAVPAPQAPAPPAPGLRIETEPAGASVWIDDAQTAAAPVTVDGLRPGPHRVRVAREGFAPAELSLHLTEGQPPPPLRFVLVPLDAPLLVHSMPAGATVRVDGRLLGITPLQDLSLSPGRHELRLDIPGFDAHVQMVSASPGQPLNVRARLRPLETRPALLPQSRALAGEVTEWGSAVLPPRRLSGNPPVYPDAARRLGLSGSVKVELTVMETGEPRDLRVLESAGALLDQAVLSALRSWRFVPASKDGVRVRARWQYRQTFAPAG